MQSEKNSTACTSHNLQTTAGPTNVSVLRTAWKLRGGAATRHHGRRGGRIKGERERDTDRRGREERQGEKETRYILYDSVIAFPRTNIAPVERTQENVDVNRRAPLFLILFLSPNLFLPLAISRSLPLRSFFDRRRFVKRSLSLFASRLLLARARFLDSPDPANLRHRL